MDDIKELKNEFARQVIAYLKKRPEAADDLQGVAYWWLFRDRYIANIELLEAALEDLTEVETVRRVATPGGRAIYCAGARLIPNKNARSREAR